MTPEKPVPAWKEQARELLHEAILEAARAKFAKHGYEGATVDEIAARAEVAKGTIYNYFDGGKAGLFVGVLGSHFDELHEVAQRHFAAAATPFRDRYQTFVAEVIAYFHVHRDLLRVHLREVPQLLVSAEGGEQADHLRVQRDRIVDAIAQPLADAIDAGEVRGVPVRPTAHAAFAVLLGHLHHTVAACHTGGAPEAEPPDAEAEARFLTDLLFEGLEPRLRRS